MNGILLAILSFVILAGGLSAAARLRGVSRSKTISGLARAVLILTSGASTLFCLLGLLASFEPMEHSVQVASRIGYGLLALFSLATSVSLLISSGRVRSS